MMNSMFHKGFLVTLLLAALGGATSAQANLPLSDVPLFVATSVDPNILINLSVETPVGGPAYNDMNDAGCLQDVVGHSSMVCYSPGATHLGYFDPGKCYLYDSTNEYFYPTGPSGANHTCSGSFSGNMLNWSTMNAIDTFVWTMTGGDRVVDTQTETVVENFGASGFWNGKSKAITATHNVAPGTVSPFANTNLVLRVDQQTGGGNSTVTMTTQGGGWNVTADSQETVAENGAADNAIDGNTNTIWHTQWGSSNPPHPHWIQIDFGSEEGVSGVRYLPRQTGPMNGTINDYTILVSSDGLSFTEVASGTWGNNRGWKDKYFTPTTARYLRLQADSEVDGNAWSSASEIEVFDESGIKLSPPVVANTSSTYKLRVKVCDSSVGLESNCATYSSGGVTTHKPGGLIQENAANRRFALSSYLKANTKSKHGGVMRSLMKYVGLLKPDGNGNLVSNPLTEWNDLGILKTDPEGVSSANPESIPSGDRLQSKDYGSGADVTYSGIVNYLNKFQKQHDYKSYDPVSELFYESLHYYRGQGIAHPGPTSDFLPAITAEKGGFPAYSTWDDPMQYSCQKNFVVAINDAYAWRDKRVPGTRFVSSDCDDDDCGNPSGADTFFDAGAWADSIGAKEGLGGLGSQLAWGTCATSSNSRKNSYYDAALAYQANTSDLRTDFDGEQSVSTFMVDVQEYNSAECDATTQSHVWADNRNHLWLVGKYGGFKDKNNNDEPDLAEEWDVDGDGMPDNYVPATQPDIMATALREAFQDIDERVSSATSIATNSTRLDTDTLIYQAKFNTSDWTGQIVASRINADGSVGAAIWDTDEAGKIPAYGSRDVFTWNGTTGAVFHTDYWGDLSASQQADLQDGGSETDGKNRLNYLRGDDTKELRNGGTFRDRTKLLGDVVNSDPVYVFNPDFGYQRLPTGVDGQSSYEAFRTDNQGTEDNPPRRKMLYLGANDGMLHAFDADTGIEQFAFAPESVFSSLADLTSPSYAHKYYVDGTPNFGDVYINGGWKTVLLGSTGAGAKSVFALDITDPDDFSENKVMWEFTDADLGHLLFRGVIARMQDGTWAAIFGNGYNSDNHRAMLYIVNVADGTLLAKIDTGVGSSGAPNGLASPAVLVDNDRTVVAAYAGDLHGNMWKFDLSDTVPGDWAVAFSSSGNPAPLFSAVDDSGNAQPITVEPKIGLHPTSGGYVIYFGTGRYFADGDGSVGANPPVQTFYGIWDMDAPVTLTAGTRTSVLQEQTIDHEVTASGNDWRVVSDNPIDWTDKKGWYIDLESPVLGGQGERSVSTSILRTGRIIFTTLIPSDDICDFGGSSWIMELSTENGGRIDDSVFDVNGDAEFTPADFVEVPDGNGGTIRVAVSGRETNVGIVRTPSVMSAGHIEYKHVGGSDTNQGSGGIEMIRERGEGTGNRSWRQLP